MLAQFRPEHPGAVCYVAGRVMCAGDVRDVTAADIARIAGLVAVESAESLQTSAEEAAPSPAPKKRGRGK